MDILPLEVTQHIFALACTDGGRTGCSLSLTSKTIRTVARSTRFHSIFLDAFYAQRLSSFVSTYEKQCQPMCGARPRVKHLYLTLAVLGIPSEFAGSGTTAPIEVPGSVPWSLPDGARALLRAVSADIISLVLQVFPTSGGRSSAGSTADAPTLSCTFPSLRELTVFGTSDPRSFFSGVSTPPIFPNLRRLHIIDTKTIYGMLRKQRLEPWTTHAPKTTHLRVSNLSDLLGPGGIPVELAAQIGVPVDRQHEEETPVRERWPRSGEWPPATHPHLRCVIIQPCNPPSSGALRGELWRSYCRSGEVLRKLAEYPAYVNLEIVVLTPPDEPGNLSWWTESMKMQWLDRIKGGPGCWADVGDDEADGNR
ncbi:uncharacterized protein TRAVEDRAFT_43987 [Trametes versicolor FP-101664 SS1]|uniref:uncharacterized protein n=1 Tax=Trametes versicolor (strain FP-101664) TaxID=717944 RepID=UPI0004621265|nr:uncharacterized protein TRAVEDRAFT_43987 [Trametes versicolor FP-101664 SS1]EIW61162.1 hypothetical protein TRAVEDRAFT_43987 [Trametes versicolor FP-101664 SS1]